MRVVARVAGSSVPATNGPRATSGRGGEKPIEIDPAKVDDNVVAVEREVLKVALQLPAVAGGVRTRSRQRRS